MFNVRLSHLVPIGFCIQTNLYVVGVNAEYRFAAVYSLGYDPMNNLTKSHIFSTLVELTTCNKVGDGSWTLGVQSVEEIIFTIDTKCLSCDEECPHLQIGEVGATPQRVTYSFSFT